MPAAKVTPTPEPTTLELLQARLTRLLLIHDEAKAQHAATKRNLAVVDRSIAECRTAIDLARNPAQGL